MRPSIFDEYMILCAVKAVKGDVTETDALITLAELLGRGTCLVAHPSHPESGDGYGPVDNDLDFCKHDYFNHDELAKWEAHLADARKNAKP